MMTKNLETDYYYKSKNHSSIFLLCQVPAPMDGVNSNTCLMLTLINTLIIFNKIMVD